MTDDGLEHQFPFIKRATRRNRLNGTDSTAYHSIHTLRVHLAFEC